MPKKRSILKWLMPKVFLRVGVSVATLLPLCALALELDGRDQSSRINGHTAKAPSRCSNSPHLFRQTEISAKKTFYWALKPCISRTKMDDQYTRWISIMSKPNQLTMSTEFESSNSHVTVFSRVIDGDFYTLNFEFTKDCSKVLSAWVTIDYKSRQSERRLCF